MPTRNKRTFHQRARFGLAVMANIQADCAKQSGSRRRGTVGRRGMQGGSASWCARLSIRLSNVWLLSPWLRHIATAEGPHARPEDFCLDPELVEVIVHVAASTGDKVLPNSALTSCRKRRLHCTISKRWSAFHNYADTFAFEQTVRDESKATVR